MITEQDLVGMLGGRERLDAYMELFRNAMRKKLDENNETPGEFYRITGGTEAGVIAVLKAEQAERAKLQSERDALAAEVEGLRAEIKEVNWRADQVIAMNDSLTAELARYSQATSTENGDG